MTPIVYLACPYSHPRRAVRVARFEAANRAAAHLIRTTNEVIFSPISMGHPIAEVGGLGLDYESWREFDMTHMSLSHRLVVLTLDGWKESKGVKAEIEAAQEMGIPVEYMEPHAV